MCGIAGIYCWNNSRASVQDVKKMTDTIAHRGPDGEGAWQSEDGKITLGHRRLAILDLSPAGRQPLHYGDGQYTISFNGEIYNYIELREDLKSRGYTFQSQTDSEVLLAMYVQHGEKCVEYLDGMFAFAIWDHRKKKLFCARDRFGEKPFFYSLDKNFFVFASEMKALFAYGIEKKVSHRRLHYYLAYDRLDDVLEPASTFFENIHQLEPAHTLTIEGEGRPVIRRYWDIYINPSQNLSIEAASERLYELLLTSVSRRLRSDVPVGSSLSGGLDSSAIVMLIDRMKDTGQKQKTFSARFHDFDKDEGAHMNAVIEKCRAVEPHFTWPDEQTFIADFEKICYHQEEPFGSASIVAQWAVMKLAKEQQVTVLLDGQGADEILAGYKPFFTPFLHQLYASGSPRFKSEKGQAYAFHGIHYNPGLTTRLMLRYPATIKLLSRLKKGISGSKKIVTEPAFTENYTAEFRGEARQYPSPFLEQNNDRLAESQKFVIQRGGMQGLLRHADRNSMAFSRELRLPFLNHQLVEFTFTLPAEFKIRDGWTKYLLRYAMKDLLPQSIVWRRDKIGYEAPQQKWLENKKIEEYVEESKAALVRRKILRVDAGLDQWKCLVAGRLVE